MSTPSLLSRLEFGFFWGTLNAAVVVPLACLARRLVLR